MLEELIEFRNYLNSLLGKPTVNIKDLIDRLDKIICVTRRPYIVLAYYNGVRNPEIWYCDAITPEHAEILVSLKTPSRTSFQVRMLENNPVYLGSIWTEEE